MDPIPSLMAQESRRWLIIAGLIAAPVFLPVGVWGVRGLWPRAFRSVASGALALGALSLVGMSLGRFARPPRARPLPHAGPQRWKLPLHGALVPEEFAASAASGY